MGGGLCGLTVLDRLRSAGKKALLLEAGHRLGGRILTLREGLTSGLRAEAGAERIHATDKRVQRLLERLGIPTVDYPRAVEPFSLEAFGQQVKFRSLNDIPSSMLEGMTELERSAFPFQLGEAVTAKASAVRPNDPRTAADWLKDCGMSDAAIRFIAGFSPYPLQTLRASAYQRILRRNRTANGTQRAIAGGTDRIIEKLSAPLRDSIQTDFAASSLEQDAKGVLVRSQDGRALRGSRAIVCLPLAVLSKLQYGGQSRLPEALQRRVDGLAVVHESKAHLEVDLATSQIHAYSMRSKCPRFLWPLPETVNGRTVLNGSWIDHEIGEILRARQGGEPLVRHVFEKAMGQSASSARALPGHDFAKDPLIGLTYTFALTEEAFRGGSVRQGRWIFAGSDFSTLSGWMEGALESAEDALAGLNV